MEQQQVMQGNNNLDNSFQRQNYYHLSFNNLVKTAVKSQNVELEYKEEHGFIQQAAIAAKIQRKVNSNKHDLQKWPALKRLVQKQPFRQLLNEFSVSQSDLQKISFLIQGQERDQSISINEEQLEPCSEDDLEVFDEVELICQKDLNLFRNRSLSYKLSLLNDHGEIDAMSSQAVHDFNDSFVQQKHKNQGIQEFKNSKNSEQINNSSSEEYNLQLNDFSYDQIKHQYIQQPNIKRNNISQSSYENHSQRSKHVEISEERKSLPPDQQRQIAYTPESCLSELDSLAQQIYEDHSQQSINSFLDLLQKFRHNHSKSWEVLLNSDQLIQEPLDNHSLNN